MKKILPREGFVVIERRKVSEKSGIILPETSDEQKLFVQASTEDSDLAEGLEVLVGAQVQGIGVPDDEDIMVIPEEDVWAVVAPEAQA